MLEPRKRSERGEDTPQMDCRPIVGHPCRRKMRSMLCLPDSTQTRMSPFRVFTRPMRGQTGEANRRQISNKFGERQAGPALRRACARRLTTPPRTSGSLRRTHATTPCVRRFACGLHRGRRGRWQTSLRLFGAILRCVLAAPPLMNGRRDAGHAGAEHDGRCHCLCPTGRPGPW